MHTYPPVNALKTSRTHSESHLGQDAFHKYEKIAKIEGLFMDSENIAIKPSKFGFCADHIKIWPR